MKIDPFHIFMKILELVLLFLSSFQKMLFSFRDFYIEEVIKFKLKVIYFPFNTEETEALFLIVCMNINNMSQLLRHNLII